MACIVFQTPAECFIESCLKGWHNEDPLTVGARGVHGAREACTRGACTKREEGRGPRSGGRLGPVHYVSTRITHCAGLRTHPSRIPAGYREACARSPAQSRRPRVILREPHVKGTPRGTPGEPHKPPSSPLRLYCYRLGYTYSETVYNQRFLMIFAEI